jgi:hypothetical protein
MILSITGIRLDATGSLPQREYRGWIKKNNAKSCAAGKKILKHCAGGARDKTFPFTRTP